MKFYKVIVFLFVIFTTMHPNDHLRLVTIECASSYMSHTFICQYENNKVIQTELK